MTKYIGVDKVANYGWRARIKVNGKQEYLGCHSTPELAANEVRKAIFKYRGKQVSLLELKRPSWR